MRTKVIVGTLLLVGALGVSVLTAPDTAAVGRKAAVVHFMRTMIVAGTFVTGPVVIEHDDAKMAHGESCTTVYRYDPDTKVRGEAIVDFMCMPRERPLATKFEATISKAAATGPDRLLEYQFAGEREGHEVPYSK